MVGRVKVEQAVPWYRTDVPPRRPKQRKRKDGVIYTRTGILDMTRRPSKKRGSHVERIVMRL
jgi:hypothetical protein